MTAHHTHQNDTKDSRRNSPKRPPESEDKRGTLDLPFSSSALQQTVLQLQRLYGNAQTRRMLIQREDDGSYLPSAPSNSGQESESQTTPQEPPEITERLDMLEREYRKMIRQARLKGWGEAADNLEHFLEGTGDKRTLPTSWLRRFEETKAAERTNQERFEKSLNEIAAQLADGETRTFDDHWDRLLKADEKSELYFASGHSTITSTGSFSLTRKGDKVTITGTVSHHWKDRYDWHGDLIAVLPNGTIVSDKDALLLEQYRGAAPFDMDADWSQQVSGVYTIIDLWPDTWEYEWSEP